MRHSTIDLTMNIHPTPSSSAHGALDVLPALPLSRADEQNQRATGTTDAHQSLQ
jgi:hypothetical protein